MYDSSGQRVAQIGVTAGTATAYLGATELTDPNTAVNATDPADLVGTTFISATRYYSLGGATVAVREAPTTASPTDKLSFLFGDVQGSAQVMVTHAVDAAGVVAVTSAPIVSRNAYTPYGATRGEGTSAANDNLTTTSHGWLNQVSDEASTGLVYLNARYYDPLTSRFISPDPQMNPSDPKTLDPYRYAENNPIAFTDPSGLSPNCGGMDRLSSLACYSTWASTQSGVSKKIQIFNKHLGKIYAAAAKSRRPAVAQGPAGSVPPAARFDGLSDREIIGKGTTEALWRTDRDVRREIQGSAQNTKDDITGTSWIEQETAMDAIWNQGASYFTGGPACGKLMECLVGTDFDFGYITSGHTIMTWRDVIDGKTQAHEYAHVLDFEYLGGAGFYGDYGLDFLLGEPAVHMFAGGHGDRGWYMENYMEQRGRAAEDAYVATGDLVHFERSDVTKNAWARLFVGSAAGLPKQSFGSAG